MAAMHDLQRAVADCVAQQGLEAELAHRLLDPVAEVGALAREALKASAYGAQGFAAGPGWADELGDVRFSRLCVAKLYRRAYRAGPATRVGDVCRQDRRQRRGRLRALTLTRLPDRAPCCSSLR